MRAKVIIPIIVIFTIVVMMVVVLWDKNSENSIEKKEVATIKNPVISPSGKYQIKVIEETIEGVKHNKFSIFKISDGKIEPLAIFTSNDAYRTRDTLYFVWDDKDRVWAYSGDAGTFFWERVSDDNWQKHLYADNRNISVPTILKELKPGYFGDK